MKKLFTLFAVLGILSGSARMLAADLPDEPGTRMVDLTLMAAYVEWTGDGNDTIDLPADFAPDGSGAYRADTVLNDITAKTIDGYTFSKWSDGVTDNPRSITVSDPMTIKAIYTQEKYVISFIVRDPGRTDTISTNEYTYGNEIVIPTNDYMQTVKQNTDTFTFTFQGWDPDIAEGATAIESQTYVAKFDTTKNRYEVFFYDKDGENVLYTTSLEIGEMPVYEGEPLEDYTIDGTQYSFSGWMTLDGSDTLHTVGIGNNSYKAIYSEKLIEYTVTVIYGDSTGILTANYGNTLELNAPSDNEKHFTQWSDGSTENPRSVIITSDTTFTALYAASWVDLSLEADKWKYICLPQSPEGGSWNSLLNTDELANVSWATYNGIKRATGNRGWEYVTMETGTLNSLQGYIVSSSQAGRLRLHVSPETLAQENVSIPLQQIEAAYEQNANWNFIGNPLNTNVEGKDITVNGTNSDEASIFVWNGIGYDNPALNEETLALEPLQAFFIQASSASEIVFKPSTPGPAPARRTQATTEETVRFDIHATAGGYTDKSRLIFRSNSKLEYEAGRDASKFITTSAPIQMYFLDINNVECAQMVRPSGDDNIRLGYMLREAGNIEIAMPKYADNYELFDALTGRSYNLSETISIYSESGTENNRLMLRPIRNIVTVIDNAAISAGTTKVLMNGQLFLLREGKMFNVQGLEVK